MNKTNDESGTLFAYDRNQSFQTGKLGASTGMQGIFRMIKEVCALSTSDSNIPILLCCLTPIVLWGFLRIRSGRSVITLIARLHDITCYLTLQPGLKSGQA